LLELHARNTPLKALPEMMGAWAALKVCGVARPRLDPTSLTAHPRSLPLALNPRVLLRVLVWLHGLVICG
jgi:hypothetical protein